MQSDLARVAAPLLAVALGLGAYASVWRRRSRALRDHYRGALSPFGGAVEFAYRGVAFRLVRVASGGGLAGTGGYPCLTVRVATAEPLALFPEAAAKYLYAGEVPVPHERVDVAGRTVCVASRAPQVVARVAELLRSDERVRAACLALFTKPFSSLRVGPHGRPHLRLVGVPEAVYADPPSLRPLLDAVLILMERANIAPSPPSGAPR